MSLKVWLIFFIISMAFSAEVLVWAMQHGQFRNVNRGRWMPLRAAPLPGPAPRRRPWAIAFYFAAILFVSLEVGRTLLSMLLASRP